MSVTAIRIDEPALTMTVSAEFDAPVERVWQIWADPRQLERWWGPPTYPATVEEHNLSPGGRVTYVMTGPEGDKHRGWWIVETVEPPRRLEITDGFADEAGNPSPEMPTTKMVVDLADSGNGTRMTLTTTFPSAEALEQMRAMGMEEGMSQAIGQVDGLLNN
jgi:uncharacterized protein YndB with AHSA1/START domain